MSCLCTSNTFVVLHPRHKLEYFRTAGWPNDWITAAEALIRDEFKHSYSLPHANKDLPRDPPPNIPQTTKNIFDDLPALAAPKPHQLRDELARYLRTDPESVADVLLC